MGCRAGGAAYVGARRSGDLWLWRAGLRRSQRARPAAGVCAPFDARPARRTTDPKTTPRPNPAGPPHRSPGIVSGQKKRFSEHGFDLDLAYITPRLVAMGLPATGSEGAHDAAWR